MMTRKMVFAAVGLFVLWVVSPLSAQIIEGPRRIVITRPPFMGGGNQETGPVELNPAFLAAGLSLSSGTLSVDRSIFVTNPVAGNGLTGGGAPSAGISTLNVGAGTGITVTADAVSANTSVLVTNVVAGTGLTGGGGPTAGIVTLNIPTAGNGLSVGADTIAVNADTVNEFSFTAQVLNLVYGTAAGRPAEGSNTVVLSNGTGAPFTFDAAEPIGANINLALTPTWSNTASSFVQGNNAITVTAGTGLTAGGMATLGNAATTLTLNVPTGGDGLSVGADSIAVNADAAGGNTDFVFTAGVLNNNYGTGANQPAAGANTIGLANGTGTPFTFSAAVPVGASGTLTLSPSFSTGANTFAEGDNTVVLSNGTGSPFTFDAAEPIGANINLALTPTWSNTANTFVQGNNAITVTAGTGLTSGGTATLGAASTTLTLNIPTGGDGLSVGADTISVNADAAGGNTDFVFTAGVLNNNYGTGANQPAAGANTVALSNGTGSPFTFDAAEPIGANINLALTPTFSNTVNTFVQGNNAITVTAGTGLTGGGAATLGNAATTLTVNMPTGGDGLSVGADTVSVNADAAGGNTDFVFTAGVLNANYGTGANQPAAGANTVGLANGTGTPFTFSSAVAVGAGGNLTLTPTFGAGANEFVQGNVTAGLIGGFFTFANNPLTLGTGGNITLTPNTAVPTTVDLGANAEGTASNFSRGDHKHDLDESIGPTWSGNHAFLNPVQLGTIQNTLGNLTLADSTTITGTLTLPIGAGNAPSLVFTSAGLYQPAAGQVGFSSNSVANGYVGLNQIVMLAPSGSPTTPTYGISSDTDTGLLVNDANVQLGVNRTGENNYIHIDNSDMYAMMAGGRVWGATAATTPRFLLPDGTAALPGAGFINDTNTGMSRPVDDTLAWSTAGTEKMRLTAAGALLVDATTITSTMTARGAVVFSGRAAIADGSFPYTATVTDYLLAATTLTSTRTFNLPAAATAGSGFKYVIKDESGSASATIGLTIDPAGAETIDGAATNTINTAYASRAIYSDGSNWFIY